MPGAGVVPLYADIDGHVLSALGDRLGQSTLNGAVQHSLPGLEADNFPI